MSDYDRRQLGVVALKFKVAVSVLFGTICVTTMAFAADGPASESWEGWVALGGGVSALAGISYKLIEWLLKVLGAQLEEVSAALAAQTASIYAHTEAMTKAWSEVGEQVRLNGVKADIMLKKVSNCPTCLKEELATRMVKGDAE